MQKIFITLLLCSKISIASLHESERPESPRDCCITVVHGCVGIPEQGNIDQQVYRGGRLIVAGCVVCSVVTIAGMSALAWYLNTHRKIQL